MTSKHQSVVECSNCFLQKLEGSWRFIRLSPVCMTSSCEWLKGSIERWFRWMVRPRNSLPKMKWRHPVDPGCIIFAKNAWNLQNHGDQKRYGWTSIHVTFCWGWKCTCRPGFVPRLICDFLVVACSNLIQPLDSRSYFLVQWLEASIQGYISIYQFSIIAPANWLYKWREPTRCSDTLLGFCWFSLIALASVGQWNSRKIIGFAALLEFCLCFCIVLLPASYAETSTGSGSFRGSILTTRQVYLYLHITYI